MVQTAHPEPTIQHWEPFTALSPLLLHAHECVPPPALKNRPFDARTRTVSEGRAYVARDLIENSTGIHGARSRSLALESACRVKGTEGGCCGSWSWIRVLCRWGGAGLRKRIGKRVEEREMGGTGSGISGGVGSGAGGKNGKWGGGCEVVRGKGDGGEGLIVEGIRRRCWIDGGRW